MDALPAIEVASGELQHRIDQVQLGDSLELIGRTLGSEPHETEYKDAKKVCFWRFEVLDASAVRDRYRIYMGEFEKDLLVFGSLLPQG